MGGMAQHESTRMGKDEWLTPPEIVKSLGTFDTDPCSPVVRPWDTAHRHFTIEDDGLNANWKGRVWCNPPYGRKAAAWLRKLAEHGNGVALIFARTETEAFFREVWGKADALLFIKGRLTFYHASGEIAGGNAGAPSVLVAYGENNKEALIRCGIEGKFVELDREGV